MKRGTPTHPKTLALAAALELPPGPVSPETIAAGLLEKLWHYASQYARRGNVGKHGDAAIARAMGWTAEPGQLIKALVGTGWLDQCSCHRLRVHDWPEHADQAVSRTEEVKRDGFLECYKAVLPLRGAAFGGPALEAEKKASSGAEATKDPASEPVDGSPAPPEAESASRKLETSRRKLDASSLPLPLPVPVPEPNGPPPGPPHGSNGRATAAADAHGPGESPPGGPRARADPARTARARKLRNDADAAERYWIQLGGRPSQDDRKRIRDALRSGLPLDRLLGSISETARMDLIAAGKLDPDARWPPDGLAPFDEQLEALH